MNDLATAFLFSVIQGSISAWQVSRDAKVRMNAATEEIAKRYQQMLSKSFSSEAERSAAAQEIIRQTQGLRGVLNSQYIPGQQQMVNNVNNALDCIEEFLGQYVTGASMVPTSGTGGGLALFAGGMDLPTSGSAGMALPQAGALAAGRGGGQRVAVPVEKMREVIVKSSGISALEGQESLAKTLAQNIDAVKDMGAVMQLTGREMNDRTKKPSEQIKAFFEKVGSVFRSGFGSVSFGEYGLGGMLNHRPLNRAKMVSLTAVPEVIKRGRTISDVANWKGRGYRSVVFAAPVSIGDTTVYVAAVVNQNPDGKFYLNECVDSEGNYIRIETNPTDDTKSGVTVQDGITATPKESVSGSTLPQPGSGVKAQDLQQPDGYSGLWTAPSVTGLPFNGPLQGSFPIYSGQITPWPELSGLPKEATDSLMRAALEMAENGALEREPVTPAETASVQPQGTALPDTAPAELPTRETPRSVVPEGEPIGLTVRQRLTLDELRYAGHSIQQVGMALKRMGPEAIRGVINQGLCSAPDMGSSTRGQVLRRKLDAGQDITPAELGHLYDALCREPTQWGDPSGQAVAPETSGKASLALTAEEKGAILAYKSSESYKINAALRDGTPLDPQAQQFVDNLDSALTKLPIYSGTVYRNVCFDDFGGQEAYEAFLREHTVNSVVMYPAFTSASKTVDGHPTDGKLVVNLEIISKSGRECAGYGNNMEKEILFGRDMFFTVKEVVVGKDGYVLIRMREVTENGQ